MNGNSRGLPDDMRPEYDFDYSEAVRGKYYRRLLKESANVVVLEPDVAKAFRSSAAVNEALRSAQSLAQSRLGGMMGGLGDLGSLGLPGL